MADVEVAEIHAENNLAGGDNEEAAAATDAQKKPFLRKRQYYCADTKCGCCCCCLCWTPLLLLLYLYISAAAQTFPATKFTNVEYTGADGVKLHGYLASPKDPASSAPDGKVPAALVFHAWNGMSEEAVYFADKLAAEGYYALAPDLFRNTAADGMNVFWNILAVLTTSQTRMDADSDAAYAFLKSTPNVDEGKIVSGPGFCFGGAQALIFGSRYKSAAVVTLYGTYISELDKEDTDAWGELPKGGPILGLYGKEDTRPGVEDVEKFRTALEKKKMAHKISIYDGVGHAFVNPEAHKDADAKGHKQAVGAWAEVVTFFQETFNSTATTALLTQQPEQGGLELAGEGHTEDAAAQRYQVPFTVSLYHRMQCAIKCGFDMFTMGEGHNH